VGEGSVTAAPPPHPSIFVADRYSAIFAEFADKIARPRSIEGTSETGIPATNLGRLHPSRLLRQYCAIFYSRPSRAKSKVKRPSPLLGRSNTSGWRKVRTASL
jgi:hypothetical protein